ncbi:MAG: hypothetical protein V1922_05020 [bacterium]
MKNKKSLKEKIIQSIFIYETKKITFETMCKVVILLVSLTIIIVFGSVIYDIYVENELGELIEGFIAMREYSFLRIKEMGTVILSEIPHWILLSCLFGVILGCILILSIIRNWSSVSHKVRSFARYWFNL